MNAQEKTILVGVTGGIAAYKMADVVSALKKEGFQVQVIMTAHATEFISPLVFETLTGRKCVVDTFDRNFSYDVLHISLAQAASALLIAPATANIIGKLAHGIADDMLTTTALACPCPKVVAPAMNTAMYGNPVVQENLATLRRFGMEIVEPEEGLLACGDVGKGRLAAVETLLTMTKRCLYRKDFAGRRFLITAGPTCESLDPVRYLTNHSTGKMGYALAEAALQRGGVVTLVSGRTQLPPPPGATVESVWSARDMAESVFRNFPAADIVIKAAAVADFTPTAVSDRKIKKSADPSFSLSLSPTVDILGTLGERAAAHQFLCGFSMETEDTEANSRRKLAQKNVHMIVANNLNERGAGFGGNTNKVLIITPGRTRPLPLMSKLETAHAILDEIGQALAGGEGLADPIGS